MLGDICLHYILRKICKRCHYVDNYFIPQSSPNYAINTFACTCLCTILRNIAFINVHLIFFDPAGAVVIKIIIYFTLKKWDYLFLCHCLHLLEHLAFLLFTCTCRRMQSDDDDDDDDVDDGCGVVGDDHGTERAT